MTCTATSFHEETVDVLSRTQWQVLSSTAALMREAPSSPSPIQHQIAQIDIDYTPGPHF
jgi:hypothetical protein